MSRTFKDRHEASMSNWNKSGRGRYMKRLLGKARRRFIKGILMFGRGKSPSNYESEVNWRGY